jgi:hypothetical protein
MHTVDVPSRSAPLWLNMVPNTGCIMPSLKMRNHVSRIERMEYRFDLDKPYICGFIPVARHGYPFFPSLSLFYSYHRLPRSLVQTHPLYYVAPYRFQNLGEELIVKHPRHAIGHCYTTPTVAPQQHGDASALHWT